MKLTIFTPLAANGNAYIRAAYESLRAQTLTDWEWVVVPNNGGELPGDIAMGDPRVRVVPLLPGHPPGIGALKLYACRAAAADSGGFVELDHDDVLHPAALESIAGEFLDGAQFVYSDFAEFHDATYLPNVYGSKYGWTGYPVTFPVDGEDRPLIAMRAPEITREFPHALRRIEWAPNHVRAWARAAYLDVGGHNPALPVADDFDLILRCFMAGHRFVRIPECLYAYRVHAAQAVKTHNADIQAQTGHLYDAHAAALFVASAEARGLRRIDLCGGVNPMPGFEVADLSVGIDLNGRWPWADNSVGVLRAQDALEHLVDPMHVMSEAYRVLAPGGVFLTNTPSTEGRGAWCDPTHVSFWNELSFRYYTSADAQRYHEHEWKRREGQARAHRTLRGDGGVRADLVMRPRFATSLLRTIYPSEWHAANKLAYVEWHGIALKPGYHHMGDCEPAWRELEEDEPLSAEDVNLVIGRNLIESVGEVDVEEGAVFLGEELAKVVTAEFAAQVAEGRHLIVEGDDFDAHHRAHEAELDEVPDSNPPLAR